MSMWVATYEILRRQDTTALDYLQWFASTTGKGYMPQGEAVSNVTNQSILSSMSEPLTASSFVIVSLFYTGQYDLCMVPPTYNAGTFQSITVSPATTGDWAQWKNIPYFVAPRPSNRTSAMTAIQRISIANDNTNIYVRVDNVAGLFSDYNTAPKFAIHIYSEDFANGAIEKSSLGLDNNPIQRPMSFLLERRSDQNTYQRYSVVGALWSLNSPITSVIEPQWDPTLGRIEAVIPISAVTSANPTIGDAWANMLIALASYNPTADTWHDDNTFLIHYRLSIASQEWIYGNFE